MRRPSGVRFRNREGLVADGAGVLSHGVGDAALGGAAFFLGVGELNLIFARLVGGDLPVALVFLLKILLGDVDALLIRRIGVVDTARANSASACRISGRSSGLVPLRAKNETRPSIVAGTATTMASDAPIIERSMEYPKSSTDRASAGLSSTRARTGEAEVSLPRWVSDAGYARGLQWLRGRQPSRGRRSLPPAGRTAGLRRRDGLVTTNRSGALLRADDTAAREYSPPLYMRR